ncbi:MAG TPA: lipopolysaccharide biosynthesis protein [Rhodocyclaceae bacterium]|nr:lipopolysaccharide biosynthesis protein [Rhodocyclaceae bacterium]
MEGHRTQVARSLLWTALESFGLCGVSLISLVLYARVLAPQELGIAALALSVVQLLNVPVEMLFHDALIRHKEANARHYFTAFSASVFLGFLFCAMTWVGADAVGRMLNDQRVAPVLQWMSLSLPCMGFSSVVVAWHRRKMEFRNLAIRSFAGRVLGGLIGMSMALAGAGVWSLVGQQVSMVAISSLSLWMLASDRPRFRFHLNTCIELARFGVMTTSLLLLALSIQRIFVLMVGAFLGSQVVGYFNLAFRSVDVLRDLFAGAVSQIALPLFSRIQDDPVALAEAFRSATQFTCVLMYPVFIGLAVCSRDMVAVIFGAKWIDAAPLVAVISLLTIYYFARMYAVPLMSARGRPQIPMLNMGLSIVSVVACMTLFGHQSMWWAVAIWAFSMLIAAPVDFLMIRKFVGIPIVTQVRGLPKIFLCACGMALVVMAVRHWMPIETQAAVRLSAMIISGALSYPIFLFAVDRGLARRVAAFAFSVLGSRRLDQSPA